MGMIHKTLFRSSFKQFIQLIKLLPNPNLFNTLTRKSLSQKAKVFSISMVTKSPQYFVSHTLQ